MQREIGALDETRLSQLVKAQSTLVAGLLRRFGVREADIDDAAQLVFLTAARHLSEIRLGAERAFLYAVSLREAGHARRTYRRRSEICDDELAELTSDSVRPDALVARKRALGSVASVLSAMGPDLRTVFVLMDLEEHTALEVGRLLDIPTGTAKSRLRRARERFHACVRLRESERSQVL